MKAGSILDSGLLILDLANGSVRIKWFDKLTTRIQDPKSRIAREHDGLLDPHPGFAEIASTWARSLLFLCFLCFKELLKRRIFLRPRVVGFQELGHVHAPILCGSEMNR